MTDYAVWQYWETRGFKPGFVDDAHDLVAKNAGLPTRLLGPEDIETYTGLGAKLNELTEMAHKPDVLRSAILYKHGGVWLDSDALVLKPLTFLNDDLETHEFIGFSGSCNLDDPEDRPRINIFATRAGGDIMREWHDAQVELIGRTTDIGWSDVGSKLLYPILKKYRDRVKLYPFSRVAPVSPRKIGRFTSRDVATTDVLDRTVTVMLSNKNLERRKSRIRTMSLTDMAKEDFYLAHFVRRAMNPAYMPPRQTTFNRVLARFGL